MIEEFLLKANGGLHARPASVFVKNCSQLASEITVICGNKKADGKSLISLLSLGAGLNAQISVEVNGDSEAADMEIVRQSLQELL